MISITAIITTHNRESLLPRALDSIYAQTHPANEVIVVDDGSADGTAQLVRSQYPTAQYHYIKGKGISAARNRAIQQARGEWLAFLDDDDEWHPDKLALQFDAVNNNPKYRLCHTNEIWIRHGKRVNAMHKHQKQGGWIYPQCLPRCVISPSSVIIHRSIFETTGLFDESLPACEDYDLWLRICSQQPVMFLDTALITKYGGHEDQLSKKHWGMDRFRIAALEKILLTNTLSDEYRQLTLQMLMKKITIYINGAKKRGKQDEVTDYRQRLQTYQQLDAATGDKLSCC